ncbi:uncharacterized protein LOC113513059 [Galleria mellonella]|uniref:Uncharacterized protein LOC113513059 n=1 Tax=Galleria mellonella TaxID=7137 RepID=A0A6J3C7E0_GALME|nr:uncharacterized protein LOC113513059 [Galleria mellonella]
MIRWRYCLVLTMLLLLPMRIGSRIDDDEDEEHSEDPGDEEDEEDDEDEEEQLEKGERIAGTQAPELLLISKALIVTRTTKKRPLECYVCAFKTEIPIRACLDPTKYRVHTMTCHSPQDKCFTSVISKGHNYESVIRGCRSGCVGSPETTCCELNRCNNQALVMPVPPPRVLVQNKSNKSIPPTVLFFVTILLLLQNVAKVAVV